MFERLTIHASDLTASRAFYDAVLAIVPCDELAVVQASGPPTRHLHVGVAAPSRAAVDAFHAAGVAAGFRDAGAPGPRPQYVEDYYGGFLLDPDGNSIEAVTYTGARQPGRVDHVWVRVADLGAARAEWDRLDDLALRAETVELVRWGDDSGWTITLVAGTPATEHADVELRDA